MIIKYLNVCFQIVAKLYSDGSAFLMVDKRSERNASSSGFTTIMHADSNIYLGAYVRASSSHIGPYSLLDKTL